MGAYQDLKPKIPDIITSGVSSNEEIECIKKFGEYLSSNKVSTSQLRRAYSEVMRLKMDYNPAKLLMLQPKMAYAVGRVSDKKKDKNKKEAYRHFSQIISNAIATVKHDANNIDIEKKRFKHLASLFEAILAYHKAEGGE